MSSQTKLASTKDFFDILTKLIAVGAVVLVAIQFILGESLFVNRTNELSGRYNSQVLPLVVLADAGTPAMNSAIEADSKAGFEAAVEQLVAEKELYGQIVSAVEAAEALIDCHRSFFCRVDDYQDFEQSTRRFWYNYRVVVFKQRGNLLPPTFGSLVEDEAKRILEADRARGVLPR